MILPIVTTPNSVLTQPAARITEVTPAIRELVKDMRETMHNAQGLGLAAPQVNQSVALCIVEFNDPDNEENIPFTVLVNPRVTWKSARTINEEEACLSIPGIGGMVKRPREVRVKAEDLEGNTIEIEAKGLFARALQHEIDHLNGILFTSYVPKANLQKRVAPDYPRV
jgi:peptide deformylase